LRKGDTEIWSCLLRDNFPPENCGRTVLQRQAFALNKHAWAFRKPTFKQSQLKSRNVQTASNPKPKKQPKTQELNMESRNFPKHKSLTKKQKPQNPKNERRTTIPFFRCCCSFNKLEAKKIFVSFRSLSGKNLLVSMQKK